eukprot:TRINITY_DN3072_c0_g1_i1.p1 TRINITY_DN3072_c0_g1~~TRINITY_DN3072_c0_g1_i1.p1  ORF type:complete len:238 (-),score=23.82 TRINITY_DN3072_c0_g1_i1:80-727(-)
MNPTIQPTEKPFDPQLSAYSVPSVPPESLIYTNSDDLYQKTATPQPPPYTVSEDKTLLFRSGAPSTPEVSIMRSFPQDNLRYRTSVAIGLAVAFSSYSMLVSLSSLLFPMAGCFLLLLISAGIAVLGFYKRDPTFLKVSAASSSIVLVLTIILRGALLAKAEPNYLQSYQPNSVLSPGSFVLAFIGFIAVAPSVVMCFKYARRITEDRTRDNLNV